MCIFLSSRGLRHRLLHDQDVQSRKSTVFLSFGKKALKQLFIFLDKRIFNHLLMLLVESLLFQLKTSRISFHLLPSKVTDPVNFHNFVTLLLQKLTKNKPETKYFATGTKFIFTKQCSCIKFKPPTVMEQTIPKTLTFKERLSAKMSFNCMRKKVYFNINSLVFSLAFKQKHGATLLSAYHYPTGSVAVTCDVPKPAVSKSQGEILQVEHSRGNLIIIL